MYINRKKKKTPKNKALNNDVYIYVCVMILQLNGQTG